MTATAIWPLLSFVVGLAGGLIGAYVGMKVGIARLETWQGAAQEDIGTLKRSIGTLEDDVLIHDVEIGDLMNRQGLPRARRQRVRD